MNKKTFQGIIYMSMFFSWLLFIPFYGPGQYLLAASPKITNIFISGHIIGILVSGWYYSVTKEDNSFLRALEKIALIVIAASMFFSYLAMSQVLDLAAFLMAGFASSWFVIRWASWLSSSRLSSSRGLVMGMTIAISNILLFAYTKLLYFQDNSMLVILLCTLVCVSGSILILNLPISEGGVTDFKTKHAIPPWHLFVFAVFAFIAGGLIYSSVYSAEIGVTSQLRSLTIFFYIIGAVIFGYLADRYSRIILVPSLFTLLGIGFVLSIIDQGNIPLHLTSECIILFGLVCADLYYWLTLADHGNKNYIPAVFAVGLSFHLVVISFTASMTEHFLMGTNLGFSPAGIIGSITMFLGIFFSFWVYSLFYPEKDVLIFDQGKAGEVPLVFFNVTNNNDRITDGCENPNQYIGNIGRGIQADSLDKLFDQFLTLEYLLTQREKELTLLLLQGYSYPQIAKQLFISTNTVKYHVRNILRKVDVDNRHKLSSVIWEGISASDKL